MAHATLLQIIFSWTSGNDTYSTTANSLTNEQIISTGAGNDKIESTLVFSGAETGPTKDNAAVSTFENKTLKVASAISNLGSIYMGGGDDKFIASLSIGTANAPRTVANPFLAGASSELTGFLNGATPNTIKFPDPAIPNPQVNATLDMGTGKDEILGEIKIYSGETLQGRERVTSPSLGLLPNLRASGITNIGPLDAASPRTIINLGGSSGSPSQNTKKLSGNTIVQGLNLESTSSVAAEISAAGITNLLGDILLYDAPASISALAEVSAIDNGTSGSGNQGIGEAIGYASLGAAMLLGNQADIVQAKVRLGDIDLDQLTAAGIQLNTLQLGPMGTRISNLNTGAGNDTIIGEVSYFSPAKNDVVKATRLILAGINIQGGSKLYTESGSDRITARIDLSGAPITAATAPVDGRVSAITLGQGTEIDTGSEADSIIAELAGIHPLNLPPNGGSIPAPSPNEARNIVGIFSAVASNSDVASTVNLGTGNDSLNAGIFGFAAAFDFNETTGQPTPINRSNPAREKVIYDLGDGHDIVTGFGTGTFKGGNGTDTLRLYNLAKIFDQNPSSTQTTYEWDVNTHTLTFAASNVDPTFGSGRQFVPRVMKLDGFESIAAVGGNTISLANQDGLYTVTDNTISFTSQNVV